MISRIFRIFKISDSAEKSRLRKIKFDFLLPIGSSCQTRYQVERFLNKKYKLKQPACFFDWLGLGGIKGVTQLIDNDFLLEPEEFQVKSIYSKNNFAPIHIPSGFRFQHDFGLTPDIKKDQQQVENCMKQYMTDTLIKYKYIGDRTRNILSSGRHIGLIYRGRIKSEQIKELSVVLSKNFDSQFYILNILKKGLENNFIHHEMVINIVINEDDNEEKSDWRGNDREWDQILKKISISKNSLYNTEIGRK